MRKLGVYGGLAVLIFLVAVGAYYGYQYYYANYAPTPEKALTAYFTAFSGGDYSRMYDMTVGVPGSPQTSGEFATQVRSVLKDGVAPKISGVELDAIGSQGTARYYKATLRLTTVDGSYRAVSMLVEMIQEQNVWKVAYPFTPSF
jgi:hypothetical protein